MMNDDDLLGCYTCKHSYEDANKVICCEIRLRPCTNEEIDAGEDMCDDFADKFKRTQYQR